MQTSSLGPIRRPVQLSDEVVSHLRELIVTGELRAGDSLTIDRLSRSLEVSATPVREALQQLNAEGFARFEPRRGYHVAPLTASDIRDVYWLQSQISGELAARAAGKLSDGDLSTLVELQAEMRAALSRGQPEAVEELNHRFHRTLNLAAGSQKLAWLLGVLVKYAPRRFYTAVSGWISASLEDHEAIISACREGNADAAREAMRKHIAHAGDLLAAHFEDRSAKR